MLYVSVVFVCLFVRLLSSTPWYTWITVCLAIYPLRGFGEFLVWGSYKEHSCTMSCMERSLHFSGINVQELLSCRMSTFSLFKQLPNHFPKWPYHSYHKCMCDPCLAKLCLIKGYRDLLPKSFIVLTQI